MPVSVHIGTRVVVDPDAAASRRGDIEDALRAAARRALARSIRETIEPRGRYIRIRLNEPQFRWTGDGLSDLTHQTRYEIEKRVSRALLDSVDDAGVVAAAQPGSDVPPPLISPCFEAFDADRYDAATGTYVIPSYKGGTARPKVKGKKDPEEMVSVMGWRVMKHRWYNDGALESQIFGEVQAIWDDFPLDQPTGYIYYEGGGQGFGMYVRTLDGKTWGFEGLGDFSWWEVVEEQGPNGPRKVFKRFSGLPRPGIGLAVYMTRDDVELLLADQIRALVTTQGMVAGTTASGEYTAQVDTIVRDEVKRRFEKITEQSFLQIEVSGSQSIWARNEAPLWKGTAKLLPVTKMYDVPASSLDPKKKPAISSSGGGPADAAAAEGTPGGGGEGADAKGDGKGAAGGKTGGKDGGTSKGEGGGERGGFVYTGQELEAKGGAMFPTSESGGHVRECASFEGEPSVDELGADGDRIKGLIEEIAYSLQIDPCAYGGNFCLAAAEAIAGRAVTIGDVSLDDQRGAGLLEVPKVNREALGPFVFVPTATVAIQFMRHLAEAVPRLSALAEAVSSAYVKPENAAKIEGFRQNDPYGWLIDWGSTLNTLVERAVKALFIMTCRVLMMQLLRASEKGIHDRLERIDGYSVLFEELVRQELVPESKLHEMLDALRAKDAELHPGLKSFGQNVYTTWRDSRSAVLNLLEGRNPVEAISFMPPNVVVVDKNGTPTIADETGRVWTIPELEQALAIRRDTANEIDPLVRQVTGDPRLLAHFTAHPERTKEELVSLLTTMKNNNESMTSKVKDSRDWAFKAAKIVDDAPHATIPGSTYALQGIHLQAHKQIGEFFHRDVAYVIGVDSLLRGVEAWEDFKGFVEFAGIIVVTIFCAPLGEALGIAAALYHRYEAGQKEKLYQSLLDPEQVISRVDVEAELFATELGVALSFIPVAGRLLGKAAKPVGTAAARKLATEVAEEATGSIARRVAVEVTKDIVKALEKGLAEAFVVEMVKAEVINELLGKVLIGPAIEQLQREYLSAEEIAELQRQGK